MNIQKLFHHGVEIPASDWFYDGEYIHFSATSFSPFTVVYEDIAVVEPTEPENPGESTDPSEPEESEQPKASVIESPQYVNTPLAFGSYGQWSPTEGLDSELEAVYTFSCVDTLEKAMASEYADWYCDFFVKLDKDLGENQIFLGGNYGSFGWVGFHNGDVTLEANKEVGLLESVGGKWTYVDVVRSVRTFICGVGDVDNALSGATFTVTLRLTNPADENVSVDVATINYTFN